MSARRHPDLVTAFLCKVSLGTGSLNQHRTDERIEQSISGGRDIQ